jgi:hypothetical protein
MSGTMSDRKGQARPGPCRLRVLALAIALGTTATGVVPALVARADVGSAPPARAGVIGAFWDDALWDRVASGGAAVADTVMSIDSGPGGSADAGWLDRRERLRNAGQKALGFVSWASGGVARNPAAIAAEAATWRAWYGVDGYYLDGTPFTCDTAAAFASTVAGLRAAHPGARIVANSYTTPPACIADSVDTVVAFSGPASAFASWSPEAWTVGQPASRFWIQVWSVAPGDLTLTAQLARSRNAGTVTVTSAGSSGYPWASMAGPEEWTTVLTAVTGAPFTPARVGPPPVTSQQLASVNYFSVPAMWTRSRSLGTANRFVLVNPDSGPGAVRETWVQIEVDAARAAGQTPLGYVHTLWGARPSAQVLADARSYRTRYGITGVFLDESADTCTTAAWYQSVTQQLRSEGFDVVALNPGRPVPECYSFADGIVVYEGSLAGYASLRPQAWMQRVPASKFWHLLYEVPQSSIAQAVATSRSKWAGVLWFTDDSLTAGDANPWSDYPSTAYLSELRSAAVATLRSAAPSAGGAAGAPRAPAPGAPNPSTIPVAPTIPVPPASSPVPTVPVIPVAAILPSGPPDAPPLLPPASGAPSVDVAAVPSPVPTAVPTSTASLPNPTPSAEPNVLTGERAAAWFARRRAVVQGIQIVRPATRTTATHTTATHTTATRTTATRTTATRTTGVHAVTPVRAAAVVRSVQSPSPS